MSERITARPEPAPTGLGWLRARLLPGGSGSLMVASYAMIIAALVVFVVFQRDLSPSRFYLGLLALSAIFVLHVVAIDLDERYGERHAGLIYLPANGLLWLVVAWASLASARFSFVPYLLFMLVAEAVVTLRLRAGAIYTAALLAAWFGLLLLSGVSVAGVVLNALSLSTGLIFVVTLAYVLSLYQGQTERAETLLAQLTAANAELEAARQREMELAVAEERVRIARDIHDGLGHHLTALNVQLQAAARLIERDPARAAAAVATSREVAQAALDEVRQSVAAMRRTPLDGRSLPEALAALVGDFGRRADLSVALVVAGEPALLPAAAAQTLYRAAQEGLTNAQRHAAAGAVRVTLVYHGASAGVSVVDDGTGAGGAGGGGFGLAGLRERAEQLGGRFEAGPLPAGGFRLSIELPTSPSEGQPR